MALHNKRFGYKNISQSWHCQGPDPAIEREEGQEGPRPCPLLLCRSHGADKDHLFS